MAIRKIFIVILSLLLGGTAMGGENSEQPPWSLSEELNYIHELSQKGKYFPIEGVHYYIIEHLLSLGVRGNVDKDDDFIFLVQGSPDNGVYRSILLVRCGDKFCEDFRLMALNEINRAENKIDIDVKCPGEIDRFGAHDVGNNKSHSLGDLQNYMVCRTKGKIRRFGAEGGELLPVDTPSAMQSYINTTYPSLPK